MFSHADTYIHNEGPTQQQLEETSFQMDFRVLGCQTALSREESRAGGAEEVSLPPHVSMRVRVSGPEPGYVATPLIFVALAKCLLKEYGENDQRDPRYGEGIEEKLALPKGGVFTPHAVFSTSRSIFSFLHDADIRFQVIE